MRNQLILILALAPIWCFAQIEGGCLFLDFENFSDGVSGLEISDQFQADFGVTFSLEGGGTPVLATVGPPTEAFVSVYGNDTPAPGVDVGQFFLTDDGALTGLTSPPLILTFETPIDSFAGCILDMDFGENFLIQAMDIDGNVILEETIRDGDPNTGDGALTCWGFNLPGCEGTIYSIKYQGSRTQSGSFGLGLDNFSFCYSGLNIDVVREPQTCTEKGSINVIGTGPADEYEYSLDGINFNESGFFDDLPAGEYTVHVRDEFGCEAEVPEFVPLFEAYVAGVEEVPTNCGLDNGVIVVDVDLAQGAVYSLDGILFQPENVFENLPPGNFTIYVEDDNGCELVTSAFIEDSDGPTFDPFVIIDDRCERGIGKVKVMAQGDNLEYTMDGINYQLGNTFENLSEGDYAVMIQDDAGCVITDSLTITTTPSILFDSLEVVSATCNEPNGAISINAIGGTGLIEYSFDGVTYEAENNFENLDDGDYTLYLIDENACTDTAMVAVPEPDFAFINEVAVQHTRCDDINGTIEIMAAPAPGLQFSIGGDFQDSSVFDVLDPGDYSITIVDENGCEAFYVQTIDPSFSPELAVMDLTSDICRNSNGTLTVEGSSPNGTVSFELDDNGIENMDGFFDDLVHGIHVVIVKDELDCIESMEIEIDSTPVVEFYGADITPPSCYEYDGIVQVNAGGGTGEFTYIIDGFPVDSFMFGGMSPGSHEILIIDELGCETLNLVEVPEPLCPIYVPDIFNPKESAPNNRFVLFANPDYAAWIDRYSIYDRWGELVFVSENFSIHETGEVWWDGFFNEGMSEQDVYTYYIEISHPRGDKEGAIGTLFLMK